jgi:hypothetical protein
MCGVITSGKIITTHRLYRCFCFFLHCIYGSYLARRPLKRIDVEKRCKYYPGETPCLALVHRIGTCIRI